MTDDCEEYEDKKIMKVNDMMFSTNERKND